MKKLTPLNLVLLIVIIIPVVLVQQGMLATRHRPDAYQGLTAHEKEVVDRAAERYREEQEAMHKAIVELQAEELLREARKTGKLPVP